MPWSQVFALPFENLSADSELNYIGFQISEYLSTAMASIEVGNMLNARRIITGTYTVSRALVASFTNNDAKAMAYLETTVADPTSNYLNYSFSAVEGQSFCVTIVRNQLDINKALSEDAEAVPL